MGGEDQERSSKPSGGVKVASKPLKKQKSITRLFSSRTSRPQPLPPVATRISSPRPLRLSSHPSEFRGTSPERSRNHDSITSSNGESSDRSNPAQSEMGRAPVRVEGVHTEPIAIIGGVEYHSLANPDSINKSNPSTPLITATIYTQQALESTLERSSTTPLLPERTSSFSTPHPLNTRTRGSSTSSQTHIFQPTPRRIEVPFRPATAGGEYPSTKQEPKDVIQNRDFSVEAEIRPFSEEDVCYSDFYSPWDYKHDSDEAWKSIRSALTSHSSFYDATSTERSSVATKNTSIGGLILDSQTPVSKHGSMTVDDAIDMYASGFTDGPEDLHTQDTPVHWPLKEEDGSVLNIAEAVNDDRLDLRRPVRPSSVGSNKSATINFGSALKADSPGPIPVNTPTTMRDQYGFLKASNYVTDEQHDMWSTTYTSSQESRAQKWLSYMGELSLPTQTPLRFPPRSAKTQRFIRKGIPPDWRGNAWFFYADGDRYLQQRPGLFANLVSRSRHELNSDDKDLIERDLHRTFPDNIRFKPEPTLLSSAPNPTFETPLLASLRRVLRAFALHCPRIGYCQSLNFIAGLLLLFLSEEKAFWMLHIITTDYFPGTHDVNLEGAKIDLWVLMVAFKESMPGLWPKVGHVDGNAGPRDARLPTISLCTTNWFMSLFIGTLPIESVLRVWDILFYEGSRTLFRVALGIFKLGEQRIRAMSDPMEILQIVQSLPRGMLDVGALMDVAFRRGGISQEWVEKRRKQRKKWNARAQAKSAAEVATDGEPFHASPPLGKTNSVWRRRAWQRTGT